LPPIPHTEKVVTGLQPVSLAGLSLRVWPRTLTTQRSAHAHHLLVHARTPPQEEVALAAIVFNGTVWLFLLLTAFLDAPADLGNSLCTLRACVPATARPVAIVFIGTGWLFLMLPHATAFTIVFVKLVGTNPTNSSSQTQNFSSNHSQHSHITHNRITTDSTHSLSRSLRFPNLSHFLT